jgi:hypothetical protein
VGSLDAYRKYFRIAKGLDKPQVNKSSQDFSLKQGEKITVNIKGLGEKNPGSSDPPKKGFSGGLKKLAPPGFKKTSAPEDNSMNMFGGTSQPVSTNLMDLNFDFGGSS